MGIRLALVRICTRRHRTSSLLQDRSLARGTANLFRYGGQLANRIGAFSDYASVRSYAVHRKRRRVDLVACWPCRLWVGAGGAARDNTKC